ncbi:MAG: type II toxin-antitoxin system VapC family toxin [Gemmatimonadota bacterium]
MDTGAWLAGFHRRDQYHAPALALFRELRERRSELVVTDLVLAELHAHLVRAVGPVSAAGFLETTKSNALVREVYADEELQQAAFADWLLRFDDQPFTFTDAVSFAVMRARGIGTAFTFDRHFAVAGFDVWPPAGGG